jgi:hypothetical protein
MCGYHSARQEVDPHCSQTVLARSLILIEWSRRVFEGLNSCRIIARRATALISSYTRQFRHCIFSSELEVDFTEAPERKAA